MTPQAPIESVRARAFRIPTDQPESDGTLRWEATTLVLVEIRAGARTGIGYTYSDAAIVGLINGMMAEHVRGREAFDVPAATMALRRAVRNLGREGLASTAISAVDTALWDLKARLLELPLASLLGRMREQVTVYGSGGFTSYGDGDLRNQVARWVEHDGCRAVKIKIGREPARDPHRVALVRAAIGDAALFVDANGAFSARQALRLAFEIAPCDVSWFEEPVTSDDLRGLAWLRSVMPAGMDVAAGEYGFTSDYFERMLSAGAVDCLQADATRCGGISGLLSAGQLCEAHHIDLSIHCAPALHLAAACAVPRLRHQEWFHDHVRIEQMLFDGAPRVMDGCIRPDSHRPGLGLELKAADAAPYAIG